MIELQQIILREISERGPITAARFMELALYHPRLGYYEKRLDQVGREGDFQTSVSVGPLFGEFLAWRFDRWLESLDETDEPLHLVEAGAHAGQLAGDILQWLQGNRPQLFQRLAYCILEPSAHRRARQSEFLKPFADQVQWFSDWKALQACSGGVRGVIFGNELLDAFPVHRLAWSSEQRTWKELGVGADGERLVWMEREQTPTLCPSLKHTNALSEIFPDGFIVEVSPNALSWWTDAANALQAGHLVAIDYGFEAEELLSPERPRGTLRGYRNHAYVDDLLADPGEQDLTAHVNWTALRAAGESCGLQTEITSPQGTFLTTILRDRADADPTAANLTPKQIRQFQTLTHPQHFGTRFQVLVQSRK